MDRLLIIVGILAIISFFKYRPWIDITREGDVLLWYNVNCGRTYKFLFNIFIFKK